MHILNLTKIRCPRCKDRDVFIEKLSDGSHKISCPACHWFKEVRPEQDVGDVVERIERGLTKKGDFYQYKWTREQI